MPNPMKGYNVNSVYPAEPGSKNAEVESLITDIENGKYNSWFDIADATFDVCDGWQICRPLANRLHRILAKHEVKKKIDIAPFGTRKLRK